MTTHSLALIILAAGKGTRMKSDKAKVLHEVFYAPMIHHVLQATEPLHARQTVVIVGHQQQAVKDVLRSFPVAFAVQEEQLGTGHAVLVAESKLEAEADTIMILCGDTPLVRPETLREMYAAHRYNQATLTLMTTILDDPTNYGRILVDGQDRIIGIVEQKDASHEQLAIREINAGIYCVERSFLFSALRRVGTDNSQGEVYLTDIVKLAVDDGRSVASYRVAPALDVLGVNSRVELAEAHGELQRRRNRQLMLQGVSMVFPQTVSVSPRATVGRDTILEAGVTIGDGCQIGQSCRIGQGAVLRGCRIGDHATIGPYSCLTDCTVGSRSTLAPFSTGN